MRVDFLNSASSYASHGWPVFPLGENSKIPAIKGGAGVKEATIDYAVIKSWAEAYPHANVGIACGELSGVLVIDLDPRNGANESISKLSMRGYVFPECPVAQTGGGGRHLFFRFDPKIGNSKDKIGKGIDIKSTGGYVVGAPSVVPRKDNAGTGCYRWLREPWGVHIPRLPIWASSMLAPAPRPHYAPDLSKHEGTIRGLLDFLGKANSGERNNRLYWCSRRAAEMVKQHRVSEGGAVSQLIAASAAIGLPHKEALATIKSAFDATNGGSS